MDKNKQESIHNVIQLFFERTLRSPFPISGIRDDFPVSGVVCENFQSNVIKKVI